MAIQTNNSAFGNRASLRPLLGSWTSRALLTAFSLLALLVPASAASADVQWEIYSVHGPQNMAPGGAGQYVVHASNVGDADTSTSYTITDTLPTNVTATGAEGNGWDCSATAFPATVVTCSNSNTIVAPGTAVEVRGLAPALIITVSVSNDATGTVDNTVAVTGGSGAATPAVAVDPTTFSSTPAGFGFVPGSFLGGVFDASYPSLEPARRAGSHPFEMRVNFKTNLKLSTDPTAGDLPYTEPDDHIRTLQTRLPAGLIGNPQAVPQCDPLLFNRPVPGNFGGCPANTQVGVIDLILQDGTTHLFLNAVTDVPIFNMVPPPGVLASFALSFVGNPVFITVALDPTDRYSVIATVAETTELLWVRSAKLSLWGVPADPAHDALRVDPNAGSYGHPFTGAPIRPFLTLPSQCSAEGAIQMRADSWQHPDAFTPWESGASEQMTECADPRFRFEPSITLRPESRTPSTPTGLNVDVSVPQKDDVVQDASALVSSSPADVAIATPPMRDVVVTLPEGMAISPSSADGLAACSSIQIGLGTDANPHCPDASKIGTVELQTPLLPDRVSGSIYLATQTDNPFGSLLALYIVLRDPERGLLIKLPGKVEADPVSGQLTTRFTDNPPISFSRLHLHFKGGPRAALVTPPVCGSKTTFATMTSWNEALAPVTTSDSFTISGNGEGAPCSPRSFDPSFVAGTKSSLAGSDSPLVTRFSRTDQDQGLGAIDVSLPRGVLGRIASTLLCPDAAANAGACSAASRIGTVTVSAGPGANPFSIDDGQVYLAGPYRDAPFGLSVVVPAKAGPFDLGTVIVRAALYVDRTSAAVRIVSDPLPTILAGIPLQVRMVDVTVDRPGFTFNPTSCAAMHSTARITSTEGTLATKSSLFQAVGCNALKFRPRLSLRVGSKGHTRAGTSIPLTAKVAMPRGHANLRSVTVVLPRSLNARLAVVEQACTLPEFQAGHCSNRAKVGSALAVTPLLRDPLRGSVYLVKNSLRPLPDLVIALRGQVDIDVTGKVIVARGNHLTSRFDTVPDVPIKSLTLRLVSGSNGPLGAAQNLCSQKSRRESAELRFKGQNGTVVKRSQRLKVAGCGTRQRRNG